MQFETSDYPSAQDRNAGPIVARTRPHETERQARADVAGVYAQCAQSGPLGVLGEANLACLREACDRASVTVGALNTRILEWLAGWEPEICAVVASLVPRAYAAGLSAPGSTGPLAGKHCHCRPGLRPA